MTAEPPTSMRSAVSSAPYTRAQSVGTLERGDGRQRLLHPPERDACAFALEPHRHGATTGLEPDLDQLQRPGENERGAERRVAGERHLDRRGEDPHLDVTVVLRR